MKHKPPVAAWYFFIFFHKILHNMQNFVKKMASSALPEAKFPFGFVTA
jgi:hypothetical protein